MSNHDRITEIYNDLRKRGIVRNIKDLSDLLDVSYTNFTQAMKGDPVRLTESLMSKVEALYASYNPDSARPLPQKKTASDPRKKGRTHNTLPTATNVDRAKVIILPDSPKFSRGIGRRPARRAGPRSPGICRRRGRRTPR